MIIGIRRVVTPVRECYRGIRNYVVLYAYTRELRATTNPIIRSCVHIFLLTITTWVCVANAV